MRPMTQLEFETLGRYIHGSRHGWQTALAEKLGRSLSSINAYANGRAVIPRHIELAMLGLKAAIDEARDRV
jgi:hypothetical protein